MTLRIMKNFNTLIYFILLIMSLDSFATSGNESKKYRNAIKRADHYYKALSFVSAIENYRKALSYHDAVDREALAYPSLQIGNCFYMMNRYHDAMLYYRRVEKYGVMNQEEKKRYFQTLISNKEYDKATEIANQIEEGLDSTHIARIANIKIDTNSYEIQNHWSNSNHDDFSPSYYRGGIVFSSNRERPGSRQKKYQWNDTYFLDLYYAATDTGHYAKTYPFSNTINSPYHEGPLAFGKNDSLIVFTRNNFTNGKKKTSNDGVNKLKLYQSVRDKQDKGWTEPKELWFNHDNYSVGHPTISSDGMTMYFASDMEGSVGEADIFVTYWRNGKWSEPENLGGLVNTPEDELFPYLYQDTVLYFASKGHVGLGGLDIYKINLNDENWEIENLGQPINSSRDDFGLIRREFSGFFSSNREGGQGGDDIYRFFYEKHVPEYIIAVRVIDDSTEEPIPNATVVVSLENTNTPIAQTNLGGMCFFQSALGPIYSVDAFHKEYFANKLSFEFAKVPDNDTLFVDVRMMKMETSKPIVLENVYYELDKADITLEAAIELDKLVWILKNNPTISIELSSHTDSRGKSDYNLDLSQRRAESAVKYIVSNGIDPSRIYPKGYGETKPVNKCVDGVECTEMEYFKNRRTEFSIISTEILADN